MSTTSGRLSARRTASWPRPPPRPPRRRRVSRAPSSALPVHRVVVGDHDHPRASPSVVLMPPPPQLRPTLTPDPRRVVDRQRGETSVPPAAPAVMVQVPPISSARSRIDDRPTPGTGAGAGPAPSSATVTSSASTTRSTPSRTSRAPECRAALCSASVATRRAATSTAAGRPETLPRTCYPNVETGGGEAVGHGLHRLGQPEVVQGGGPQPVDDAPHGRDGPGQQRLRPGRDGGDLVVRRPAAHLPDLERHCGEHRAEVVVQVAAQAAPLLLARGDDAFAGGLERLPQLTAWAATATWRARSSRSLRSPARAGGRRAADRPRGGRRRFRSTRAAPGCRRLSGSRWRRTDRPRRRRRPRAAGGRVARHPRSLAEPRGRPAPTPPRAAGPRRTSAR